MSRISVSPLAAPVTAPPLRAAPVAAVVPSYILVVVPPIVGAVAVRVRGEMLATPLPVDAVVLERV